jgi:hypothetical protein
MNAEKVEKFPSLLDDLAADLRDAISQRDATKAVQLASSIGRLSRMDAIQSQQMALALKERQRQQLSRVQRFLNYHVKRAVCVYAPRNCGGGAGSRTRITGKRSD